MPTQTENGSAASAAVKKGKKFPALRGKWRPAWTALFIVLIIVFAIVNKTSVDNLFSGTKSQFESIKNDRKNEIYKDFYDRSYEAAEKANHVSNRVGITVSDIQTESQLEVLTVQKTEYLVVDGGRKYWFKATGSGKFEVNMSAAEFLVDDERVSVVARIPCPVFSYSGIDEFELLFSEQGITNGSVADGNRIQNEQRGIANDIISKELENEQSNYTNAQNSAKIAVENMIFALNANVPDLKVYVEFID